MELNAEQLERFQALYRERFGVVLDRVKALELALALVGLMRAVYRPMTDEDLLAVQERRKYLSQQCDSPMRFDAPEAETS